MIQAMSLLVKEFKRALKPGASLRNIKANLLVAWDIRSLKRTIGWVADPILDDDWIYRRVRRYEEGPREMQAWRRHRVARLRAGACGAYPFIKDVLGG
jgi:hypothetical protein